MQRNNPREISDWIEENLENHVSTDTISATTQSCTSGNKVMEITHAQSCLSIRLSIDKEGHKELLDMYISKNEGAIFWFSILHVSPKPEC